MDKELQEASRASAQAPDDPDAAIRKHLAEQRDGRKRPEGVPICGECRLWVTMVVSSEMGMGRRFDGQTFKVQDWRCKLCGRIEHSSTPIKEGAILSAPARLVSNELLGPVRPMAEPVSARAATYRAVMCQCGHQRFDHSREFGCMACALDLNSGVCISYRPRAPHGHNVDGNTPPDEPRG